MSDQYPTPYSSNDGAGADPKLPVEGDSGVAPTSPAESRSHSLLNPWLTARTDSNPQEAVLRGDEDSSPAGFETSAAERLAAWETVAPNPDVDAATEVIDGTVVTPVDSTQASEASEPLESGDQADAAPVAVEEILVDVDPGQQWPADDDADAPAGVEPDGTVDLTDQPVPAASHAINPELFRNNTEPTPEPTLIDPAVPGGANAIAGADTMEARRQARDRALGVVAPGADVVVAQPAFTPPSVYRRWPSFALFMLRLVVAAILGIRATQQVLHFSDTQQLWTNSILPNPEIVTLVQIIVEYAIAVMLLLGLASRAAGVLLLLLSIGLLTFLIWGATNPFTGVTLGFHGEFELLLAGVGLLFAGVGGGAAAVDGAVHRAHLERKNARLGAVVSPVI
ncbi:MAG: DoxX family protein [Propionibacteriaceae bacterium]|jgi:uncharacterized membrane protein YphA (DoxX/SURF4 family)|nr:DoxX family protein [Propionibacteriaceae bacterium]